MLFAREQSADAFCSMSPALAFGWGSFFTCAKRPAGLLLRGRALVWRRRRHLCASKGIGCALQRGKEGGRDPKVTPGDTSSSAHPMPAAPPDPLCANNKNMNTKQIAPWAAHALVAVGLLVMLAPFYFMFVFATHSRTEIFSLPPPLFFGDDFLNNLTILTTRIPFWRNLGWSVYVALASTALTLLFCSMGGYAFAMFEFRFKRVFFGLVMGTMLLPSFMSMIPTFMIMDVLGWIDQPRALYLPGAASAFGIFLMRQFVGSAIPRELVEAVRMDGCSELGIYARIVLPLLKPALGTLGLITFIASWNNLIGPLIVLRSPDNYTLPLALRSLQSPVDTEWGALMTGSAIATLPLIVLFVLSSKQLISGLTTGAVK